MRRNDGIVIVASLIVMMVVLAISVGMLFLTQTNLKITDNARSKAEAQALAEGGTDAMLIGIERYYDSTDGDMPTYTNKTFGTGFSQPTISINGSTIAYAVEHFGPEGSDFVLRVSGETAKGATHVSEVLFEGSEGDNVSQPVYANGLVSEGVITLHGKSNFVSAGLHGNAGYSMSGFDTAMWKECLERNENTGICTKTKFIDVEDLPVSAATGRTSWTCSPNHDSICDSDGTPKFKVGPVTITPNYLGRRDAAITAASQGSSSSTVFGINCDTRYTTAPTGLTTSNLSSKGFGEGKTVCIEFGTTTFPKNANLKKVNIISKGQVLLQANTLIEGSLIVSTTSNIGGSPNNNIKVTVRDSRIYSQGNLSFNGQQSSFEGITTLASAGSIEVNGSSSISRITDTNGNKKIKIGVGFVAEGNITISGSSNWFATSVTGGDFTYNGRSILHGSVAAKGQITANGGIDIDSGLELTNDDFLQTNITETLAENSRR